MTSIDVDPLDRIGIALVSDIQAHGWPNLNMYVNMDSWEDEAPTFAHWPCPAYPSGEAGKRMSIDPTDLQYVKASLFTLYLTGSRCAPSGTPDYLTTSINSNFACNRIFHPEGRPYNRAPDIHLPGPGFAHYIPTLRKLPNVTVSLAYYVDVKKHDSTESEVVYVHLISRFGSDASFTRTHNAHLIDAPIPTIWTEGKQFGDAQGRSKKKKKKKTTKRKTRQNDTTQNPDTAKRIKLSQ